MKIQKWVIVILLILIFSFLICYWFVGITNEKYYLVTEVKRYVEKKYGLTSINIKISFSIDGMDSALVSTEELPFNFQVYVDRDRKIVIHDLYLEALTEHHLEKLVCKKLISLVDISNIRVVLENRFSKNSDLTIEEINSNPNILLNNPNISYFCSIDDVAIDSEKSYLIFNQITQFFNPVSIYFNYTEKNGEKMSVCIKNSDFNKIHNKEGLKTYGRFCN